MLEQVLLDLVAKYAPEWKLSAPSTSVSDGVVELRGALPETLHFGSARVALAGGVLVLVDEDYRGGDAERARATLTADELARVRAAVA